MKARLSGTYLFRDKDPVIDYLRTPYKNVKRKGAAVARDANVAPGTVYNMFDGTTRRPKFYTVVSIARALGPEAEEALVKCLRLGGRGLRVVENNKKKASAK
jgi:DNA-binding phage protein